MHMHVITVKPIIRNLFKISLDGFLGDAVIGGSYGPRPQMMEKINNRARRFIILGSRLLRDDVESRFPFFDNRFLEMAISLPEKLLKDSRIYRKMLIAKFPQFFQTIPWQKTGSPIAWPNKREVVNQAFRGVENKLVQLPGFWRLANRNKNKNFENYSSWMRHESSRRFIEDTLFSSASLYLNFLSRDKVQHEVAEHMRGADYSESIGRVLTFEIWLQQVFQGRFRPEVN
jgi:asparagine synthase (glutamine-hydrolysing)